MSQPNLVIVCTMWLALPKQVYCIAFYAECIDAPQHVLKVPLATHLLSAGPVSAFSNSSFYQPVQLLATQLCLLSNDKLLPLLLLQVKF